MLVFIDGNEADRVRKVAAALADRIGQAECPAAVIDAPLLASRRPAREGVDARAREAMAMLGIVIDRREENGVRRHVVIAPESTRPWLPGMDVASLAFWLRRRAGQRILRLTVERCGTIDSEAARLVRMIESNDAALQVTPRRHATPVLETSRLYLKAPSAAQVAAFHDAIVGTDVFDTVLWDGPESVNSLLDYWVNAERRLAAGHPSSASFAYIEKSSGAMIGSGTFRPSPGDPDKADIGYLVAKPWHGRGYATEAAREIVRYGFERCAVRRIEAEVFIGNLASRRVLEKCGFQLEGTAPQSARKRGDRRDEWSFGLVREAWELDNAHGGSRRNE